MIDHKGLVSSLLLRVDVPSLIVELEANKGASRFTRLINGLVQLVHVKAIAGCRAHVSHLESIIADLEFMYFYPICVDLVIIDCNRGLDLRIDLRTVRVWVMLLQHWGYIGSDGRFFIAVIHAHET